MSLFSCIFICTPALGSALPVSRRCANSRPRPTSGLMLQFPNATNSGLQFAPGPTDMMECKSTGWWSGSRLSILKARPMKRVTVRTRRLGSLTFLFRLHMFACMVLVLQSRFMPLCWIRWLPVTCLQQTQTLFKALTNTLNENSRLKLLRPKRPFLLRSRPVYGSQKLRSNSIPGYTKLFGKLSEWSIIATSSAQHKNVVKRFTDSLLTKINKLRALIKDLGKNYAKDSEKHLSSKQHLVGLPSFICSMRQVSTNPRICASNHSCCGHTALLQADQDLGGQHCQGWCPVWDHDWLDGQGREWGLHCRAMLSAKNVTKLDWIKVYLKILGSSSLLILPKMVGTCRKEDEGGYHGVRFSVPALHISSYYA